MSTKTITKRIALVAATALALGGFSVISAPQASAAAYAVWSVAASQGATAATTVTAGEAYTSTALSGSYFPTVTLTAGSADNAYLITSTGVGSMYGTATFNSAGFSGAVTYNNATSTTGGFAWHKGAAVNTGTAFVDTNTVIFAVTSAVAGVQVLTATPVGATSVPITYTITWGAAPVVSASASTSYISTVINDSSTADVASIQVPNTAGTQQAVISVVTKSATATTIAGTGLRATISGPGSLGIASATALPSGGGSYATAASGRDISISGTSNPTHTAYIVTVRGDGTSGVSTITLTAGTTVIATETLTFYGSLATLKATVKKNVANTGVATTAALDVVGYDAAGVIVPSVGITLTSATTATIATFTETTSTAAEVAAATAVVDATGNVGTFGAVVLSIKDTATGLITTTATVNVGATEAATVTATLDAPSYSAGDKVTLTLTAKDKNGVPVADSTGAAASLAIATNGAVQGTLPTVSAFKLGTQVITFYAPLVAASLTVNVTLTTGAEWATALDGTTIVASATVEGDGTASLALDAANAATDAANNAYDEAQNATQAASDALAAVTALAAQVKSLIDMVKKLTAAVAKLKK